VDLRRVLQLPRVASIALVMASLSTACSHSHELDGALLSTRDLAVLDSILTDTARSATDRFGQPLDTTDRRYFVGLLLRHQFDSLELILEERHQAMLQNIRHEGRLFHAFESFYQGNPTIASALAKWRDTMPASAHAEAATAFHLLAQAIDTRGSGAAIDTDRDRFRAMAELAAEARRHADEALRREPRHLIPHIAGISLLNYGIADSALAVNTLQSALVAHPTSYHVRSQVLVLMEPRWGGSIEMMRAFVESGKELYDSLPVIRSLAGSVPRAEARAAHSDPGMALALLDQASVHGEDYFLALDYGNHYRLRSRWIDALKAYNRALAIRPQGRSATEERAELLVFIGVRVGDDALRERVWAFAERELLMARELRMPNANVARKLRTLAVARGACRVAPAPCFQDK
jgi:tetratricopeptide (TPR) repeat protein